MRRALPLVLAAVLLAGCARPLATGGDAGADALALPPRAASATHVTPERHAFEGTITGSPVAPGRAEHAFATDAATVALHVSVSWTLPASALTVALVAPGGRAFPVDARASGTTVSADAAGMLRPGAWTLVVASERAASEPYRAEVTLDEIAPGTTDLAPNATIAPGDFLETNLVMLPGGSFDYAWKAGAALVFNVHSHADGRVTLHENGTWSAKRGAFTAPAKQIYSLMWENAGQERVRVEARVRGDVHEYGAPVAK